ncbi:hypothetical protein ACFPFU_24980 [Negadavirga shengliensis]|uniref:Uncharacterized protein n=1 Tax=Negadavirga shengliensis TaxID=1389218 RepID=A0ABV9T855_9BACT
MNATYKIDVYTPISKVLELICSKMKQNPSTTGQFLWQLLKELSQT